MTTETLPNSLLAFLEEHPDKFDEGWTGKDHSHWVYLKKGWANTEVEPWGGMHVIHETSVRKVRRQFRLAKPCTCEDCIL